MAAAGLIFHFLVFSYYSYCMYFMVFTVSRSSLYESRNKYAGIFKFMTIWNMIFQIIYFLLCCLIDLIETSGQIKIRRNFCQLRDWFLAALAYPFTIFVFSIFWTLWAIDRELVLPRKIDAVYPFWLNLSMHSLIFPVILIEMCSMCHRYPSKKNGLRGMYFVGITYLAWVLWLGNVKGIWVYPFIALMNSTQLGIFFTVCFALGYFVYLSGDKICGKFQRIDRYEENLIKKFD